MLSLIVLIADVYIIINISAQNVNSGNSQLFNSSSQSIYNFVDPLHFNENESFEYIIITAKECSVPFSILSEYKNQYITTKIVIINDILNNPDFWVNGSYGDGVGILDGNIWVKDEEIVTNNFSRFNDTAAKIRNFIRFAHQNWGTSYVLLGGDCETIPARKFYVNLTGWYSGFILKFPIEAEIPSDMYYGHLNGSWNDDFDDKFGEEPAYSVREEADFTAEVFIGRAPVDNAHDVLTFVKKVISFETSEKPKNVLLHQSNLHPWPKPDTSIIAESCAELVTDDYSIYRLYQKNEPVTVEKWIEAFSIPPKFLILHIGNGYEYGPTNWWYQLNYDLIPPFRTKFKNSDVPKLRNGFFPIHISISCVTGNFCNNDCIAEELLMWSQGGPSACFFNSEVGCVEKSNVSKYSSEFIKMIFYEMFQNSTNNLGRINSYSKYHFTRLAKIDATYRFCTYEINLLGDPETPIFEKRINMEPKIFIVDDDFNDSTYGWNISCFNRLQDAIDKAPFYSTILVKEGNYNETIHINKTLNIIGENKDKTIIQSHADCEVILLSSNSSVISNLTIRHTQNLNNNEKDVGIRIPENCWGNEISYNSINNNSKYGIQIEGSCRNFVHFNVISNNGQGISLVKNLDKKMYTKNISLVVTCYNIIERNIIKNNEEYGIYLKNTLNNHILNNTFIDNGLTTKSKNAGDAYFEKCRNIYWEGNYWSGTTDIKLIHGTWGPIFIRNLDFSRGVINAFIFPLQRFVIILNIGIPFPAVDYNPSQNPIEYI